MCCAVEEQKKGFCRVPEYSMEEIVCLVASPFKIL
jgi:hypothetical protein